MKTRLSGTLMAVLAGAGLISSVAVAAPTSAPRTGNTVRAIPSNFADSAFQTVWTRTDELVDNGSVKRGYFWGPTPGFRAYEEYAEGPGGQHLVQYFDKSRMEINNPNGNKADRFYVTNGLLTRELISGQMQVGNSKFVQRWPAEINMASDIDDLSAPTYASFRYLVMDRGSNNSVGQPIVETIDRKGATAQDSRYSIYGVKYAYFESATRHNIPDVFWQFLNQTGPVKENGKTVNARLNDPYFYATGYPITEAFWASVKIAGVGNTAVLIQPYERRVLTYVPTAPQGFKVQMGNIGQHYYSWRYQDAGKPQVPATPPPYPSITARACNNLPVRGFGKVWADNPHVPTYLGCPHNLERGVTVAYQPFQHGYMLGLINYIGYGPYGNRSVMVLFNDGTVQWFADTYVEGEGEPEMNPPAGLHTPRKGFGKIWREGTGARVRERLGWATAPETVAVATGQAPGPVPSMTPTLPPAPTATPTALPPGFLPGGGAAQEFERGTMVYAGPNVKRIFVLYASDQYRYAGPGSADRWLVFEDTFRAP
ncbi:MAG: hypothetical protein M3437_10055 [Chloroflexota bacterium]|nr:hypothetical protein [Chloroflexota bacterium]MDQ5865433.1 hypothetical protein [Chloroflexota bacterium]